VSIEADLANLEGRFEERTQAFMRDREEMREHIAGVEASVNGIVADIPPSLSRIETKLDDHINHSKQNGGPSKKVQGGVAAVGLVTLASALGAFVKSMGWV